MFVISDFSHSDSKFDSDTYKNFCHWKHFLYQKFCRSSSSWRFFTSVFVLFFCKLYCFLTSCDLDCQKLFQRHCFLEQAFLTSLVIQFCLFCL